MKKPNLKAPNIKAPNLKAPSLKSLNPAALAGGSRTGTSLLAAAAVLAVGLGIAELRPPVTPAAADGSGAVTTAQVERTSLVCPQPLQGLTGSTNLTLLTPAGGSATGGSASLSDVTPQAVAPAAPAPSTAPSASASGAAAAAPSDARLALTKVGVPVTGPAFTGDIAPGALAVATGAYAPGFTVTQTTTVTDQRGLGMSGINCAPSGTNFWFAGASTAGDRVDYVSLVNADTVPAVVDLKLYGDKGPIDNDATTGITVAPGASQAVLLLPNLTKGPVNDLAVQVIARSGRVGAAVHTADGSKGADWIPASADPAASVVMPGLPADTATAHLVVAVPGDDDADLKIQISGKNGWFTPAGHETIHVKAGMVAIADLGTGTRGEGFTRGEVGALRLTPTDPAHQTPIVASLRVDRTKDGKSDAAWITGSIPVGKRASIAENRGGGASTLYLTSTGAASKVKLTSSAGSGGGTPATKEVDVPAGATVGMPVPEPGGLNGVFGLTVETVSGGPVVAARMLAVDGKGVPMFTIQALRDDHSTVRVPQADQEPGLLVRP
ncbi:DUF5719 family protein [Kitasatospora atroaurantiaca]|uniref:Secreted protein n=1 Tax=Kitasatospora atroaurantiaca TaxID=285545 RepID=A0A561EPT8_9ACTN|nr:DUF5719 family protein [Kitasatospora atroaurantiaca]TWE17620.1 hypothetical protein FB465_2658 [Kitasatospora atroaurantiaca]